MIAQPTSPVIDTNVKLQLKLEDVLASSKRLWLRGRVLAERDTSAGRIGQWLGLWRGRPTELPAQVSVESRISGTTVHAQANVDAQGRFETLLDIDLPTARRGWRVARHHVQWGDNSADACSLVLTPPLEADRALVVFLPTEATLTADGIENYARSPAAGQLGRWLASNSRENGVQLPVYCVAAHPADAEPQPAELALATTSLGWPPSTFVMVPDNGDPTQAFRTCLERMRQLFAGVMELIVVNAEPAAANALTAAVAAKDDLAPVQRVVQFDGPAMRESTPLQTFRPTRAARVTRYPVVFCHGMLAFSRLKMCLPAELNCYTPLSGFLRERGFRVLFPQVPPTSGVEERAPILRDLIRNWTDEPVNIIAHSMGGLDARHMITHLGMAERVRTLTTISSPHRGTYLSEWFHNNFRYQVPVLQAFEAFGVNVDGFRDTLPEVCRAFNERTPNHPEVRYFSYGAAVPSSMLTPALRRAWSIVTAAEGPNDGMVSVESARWGEYLGTILADHFAQTPDAVFLRPGEDFDCLGFYLRLLEDLARRGY